MRNRLHFKKENLIYQNIFQKYLFLDHKVTKRPISACYFRVELFSHHTKLCFLQSISNRFKLYCATDYAKLWHSQFSTQCIPMSLRTCIQTSFVPRFLQKNFL